MFDLTKEFINQVDYLKNLSKEEKRLLVDLLIYENEIQTRGTADWKYKEGMNQIIDKYSEKATNEKKN